VTDAVVLQQFALRLQNDLYCVEWGVKLYSLTSAVCPGTNTTARWVRQLLITNPTFYNYAVKPNNQFTAEIDLNSVATGDTQALSSITAQHFTHRNTDSLWQYKIITLKFYENFKKFPQHNNFKISPE